MRDMYQPAVDISDWILLHRTAAVVVDVPANICSTRHSSDVSCPPPPLVPPVYPHVRTTIRGLRNDCRHAKQGLLTDILLSHSWGYWWRRGVDGRTLHCTMYSGSGINYIQYNLATLHFRANFSACPLIANQSICSGTVQEDCCYQILQWRPYISTKTSGHTWLWMRRRCNTGSAIVSILSPLRE